MERTRMTNCLRIHMMDTEELAQFLLNEFVDDECRFFIENHKNKYFLCDKDGGIVRIYEEDTDMVQVYEDVITYMVEMN